MKKIFISVFIFVNLVLCDLSFGVMANPNIRQMKQPDGTPVNVYLCGDEFYSWFEDEDGYTVIQNAQTKEWSYAKQNDFGELEPSDNLVGKVKPADLNLKKSLKDENKLFKATQKREQRDSKNLQKAQSLSKDKTNSESVQKIDLSTITKFTGKKTSFVMLIEFSDLKFRDNPPFVSLSNEQIRTTFDQLLNKKGYSSDGAVGSVKDYFDKVSYGKLTYTSVVSPIITLEDSYLDFAWNQSGGEEAAVENLQKAIIASLKKLESQGYNFKDLWPGKTEPDLFFVIHAGGGAESGNMSFIWSHQAPMDSTKVDGITFSKYCTAPAGRGYDGDEGLIRIGVICHESVHFYGVPDLYDITYASSGLGNFCLMAAGEWNGDDGKRPGYPCAWVREKLGWMGEFQTAVEGINSIGESATDENAFYKFAPSNFDSREYFLMENRQSVDFDKDLPGGRRGILIYHVDERQSGNYRTIGNPNYLVQLEEAGSGTSNWRNFPLMKRRGQSGSDSDYFRKDTVAYFNDECTTSPDSKSYSGLLSNIKISEISSSGSNMSFIYGKDIIIDDDISHVKCYPNPIRDGYIKITGLPTTTKDFSVEIFTITSKLVKSFSVEDTEYTDDGFRFLKWDCKNESGEEVAPGVYLILVKNNSKKKVFKVAVIR
ncbi:MAG: M6 family metalloprotease domain-containing protein [Elusimicrobia bacterium]|nr:M6 family metalloprotease domain-containing protein [Elusimicrobiota bacterium]